MPSRRNLLRNGLLCVGGSLAGWRLLVSTASGASDLDSSPYQTAAAKFRPLFGKKKPPQPGDWLASHQEEGQTFAQYLKSNPNRRNPAWTKLYLQPIGDFSAAEQSVARTLQLFMKPFFGMDVVILQKIGLDSIPQHARREFPAAGMNQILSTYVLDHVLRPRRPKDAAAVLAITPSDLWPGEGWNFVFGQASLGERVGVWSTSRFGDPVKEPATYLRRVLQVAIHETGHMFGIKHCIAYECCMNGSNSLEESDRAPLVYCPECDPKLWWACKLDPATRAKSLADFAKRHALERDAELWNRIAKTLGAE